MPRTDGANFAATTLTTSVSSTDLILDVGSTFEMVGDAYVVVDPRNNAKREVIRVAVTSDTRFTADSISDRYLQGSAESSGISHDEGAEVWSVPVFQVIDDLWDGVEAALSAADAALSTGDIDSLAKLNSLVGETLATQGYVDGEVSGLASEAYVEAEVTAAVSDMVESEDVDTVVKLTQAEYDGLTPAATTLYLIVDE